MERNGMKDFLKDQLPFILFFYSQCTIIIGIAQLSTFITKAAMSTETIIYLFILPTFFLVAFLLYRYYKFREFYTTIRSNMGSTDDSWFPEPANRLLDNIKLYHDKQTAHYTEEIDQLERQKQLEFHFMQQWVHQMKTPISVLHLIIQKEKLNLTEAFHHSVQEEIERLQRGLDLALYQSRLQKFDRDFHVQQISLKQVATEVIQEFKSSFIRNQVFPSLAIDESYVVATDPKWLKFVLSQIVSNAIKYSKESSENITFTAAANEKVLQLNIQDTGCGIPSQDIQRVFDPFFTGLNGRTFRESTGMGLYLSKEICDALGHNLIIHSEQDKGTTVTITFSHAKI